MDPTVDEQREMYEATDGDVPIDEGPPEDEESVPEAGLADSYLETIESLVRALQVVLGPGPVEGADLKDHAQWLAAIRGLKRELSTLEQLASDATAARMMTKTVIVDGLGMLSRHERKSYTQWDKDALRMSVADSRLVNTATGEIVEESPLDKVLHVWNLGTPRLTALRARGLDPDEFSVVEKKPGWTVEIKGT